MPGLSIQQDDETGLWFVATPTGPLSWRYHRTWQAAWIELKLAALFNR